MASADFRRPKTIMVVDDVKGNRLLLEKLLTRHTNYQVTTVSSGQAVFEVLQTQIPDLILMDIMMPGMDGYETTHRLKKTERYHRIPIIFLTEKPCFLFQASSAATV